MTSPKNTFKQRVFSLTTLLQVDAKEDEGTSFIFMSDEAMTKDKLMILIHGSGVVRAGQWARRYLIQRVNKIFFSANTSHYFYEIYNAGSARNDS